MQARLPKGRTQLRTFVPAAGSREVHLPILATIHPTRHWLLPKTQSPPQGYDKIALQTAVRTGAQAAVDMQVRLGEAQPAAEVIQSISDGDQHVAYQTLKLLRPWQPARQYAKDVFAAHQPLLPISGPRPLGATAPDLVGGLTFALDLSQAFDTVSRQKILSILTDRSADPDTVRMVHSLHHKSSYKIRTQGISATVETTVGIKQGCKLSPTLFSLLTGELFESLIAAFGRDQVVRFLTGYADDLALHRTIRSLKDLQSIHALIGGLLETVKAFGLVVNKAKCVILVKLAGKTAPQVVRRHSCTVIDAKETPVKGWRIGPNKTFPAFQWTSSTKYLGVIISYNHFEQQTLQHRISEAKQKLHLVRKFVHNRRIASTKSRLKVWLGTVQSTLLTGIAEVGLSEDSAQSLRSWHAYKVRTVLNQPAHIGRVSTKDLYAIYKLEDPAQLVLKRLRKRLRKLRRRARLEPDITTSDAALTCLRAKIRAIEQFPVENQDPARLHSCELCGASFETAQGVHLHRSKIHPESIDRFIPDQFDRLKHAVEGMPQCAACLHIFKQWKGLRGHLLSGACPSPAKLRELSISSHAAEGPVAAALQAIRVDLAALPEHLLGVRARRPVNDVLNHRCLVCNFWTPDRTKVKSHFRQAHPQDWRRLHASTAKLCAGYSFQLIKGQMCPFCGYKVHDRRNHPEQCPVLYQLASQWLRTHTTKVPSGSLDPAQWQGRTDGEVDDTETGYSFLMLPMPTQEQIALPVWGEGQVYICDDFRRPALATASEKACSTGPNSGTCHIYGRRSRGGTGEMRGARRVTALSNLELTTAFLVHDEQISLLQHQLSLVYKLPIELGLSQVLQKAVKGWQKAHEPAPRGLMLCCGSGGSTNERYNNFMALATHRPNLKKTHLILDLRIALYSELMPYSTLLLEVSDTYDGERLGKKAPGGLARKARGKA
ncbi:RXLR78 [Symbiodinium sp. CCMP2456]|nr:RXLR78 [Symbiodinium sp. CCMP2456]